MKIVGIEQVLAKAKKIAKSQASVLITGESGTGKELIAHAIHEGSGRKEAPFIRVNCAAIPESLVESEFFGHERGAFTGAGARKPGRFELAHKGTLLLDEITEFPLHLQAKLLRAIQEGEFERVGGTSTVKVDSRLIATSNRDIQREVTEGRFRSDLYYRLNVVPLYLPPLRERKQEILPLALHFLEKMATENGTGPFVLSKKAESALLNHPWPGNVRELANIIERAVVLADSPILEPEDLYLEDLTTPTLMTLQELEKRHILETLRAHNENKTHAAKALGISIRTLRNKLETY